MNMKLILTLLILLFGSIHVACNTSESDPIQYYVKQGSEAILECTYENEKLGWKARQIGNLTWAIIASGGSTINDTKYRVSTKPSSVKYYRLHILNSQPDDELIYRCSGGLNTLHFIQLNLYVPPSRIYFKGSTGSKLEGQEGTDLVIKCIADGGNPVPNVSILNGSMPSGMMEVSYTVQKISRDYHQNAIVCQATSAALGNPMIKTVQIYLNLKPLTPVFNKSEVSTEETVPLRVLCTSYGSRPAADFTWTIDGNNVTSDSTKSVVLASNDTNTVTSTLTSIVDRSNNNKFVTCLAFNELGSTSSNTVLNVKYAPDITVTSRPYTQSDADRTVTCNPSGNPDSYTYHKWQHRSRYGDLIREFNGNRTLKLPYVPVLSRYQDSGEYVCIASNGIKGKDHQNEQTGSAYVTVNAQPVFTSDTKDRVKHFGEVSKTVDIYFNVYSDPTLTSVGWTADGKPVITQNSNKYEESSFSTTVMDEIHGQVLKLDGYNITLTIHDLIPEDFTNYTVTIQNGIGTSVKNHFMLESASVPETPGNFSRISLSATSIKVQWDPNSGSGFKQTFHIQYRLQGLLEWKTELAGEEDVNQQKRRRTYEVTKLQVAKAYELRMYAENAAGKRSNYTEILVELTKSSDAGSSTGAVIGGVAGSLIAVIIVLLVIVCVLKKRKERATPSMKLRSSSEAEEDDGLKDNILYESSQSDGLKKNVLYQSAGPDFKSQNKTSTPCEYAVVQKPNAIYAEVNKDAQPKKAKEKKPKDQKEKLKKNKKVKAKALNNNPEEEYANSALPLQNLKEEEYANSTDAQGPSGHHTNAQGLEYADLTFRQIATKNKKQVIHGIDERTIYADVDHTKKAPPPPAESEYEETNIKHGKIA